MKRKIIILFSVGFALITSCASIVSKSVYPLSINSSPLGASISVINSYGIEFYKGNTPAIVNLKASDSFFKRANYRVKFTSEGYDEKIVPINFKVDGWYWGNILLGGVIGMLIIDPATGAMYKLDTEFVNETLSKSTASIEKSELRIYGINQVPENWKDHLVRVSE